MKKALITIASILAVSTWITACSPNTAGTPESPVTTTAEVEEAEFSTGSWDGSTFTSPWLNIRITFPEDSIIATEEQIKEITGVASEIMQESKVSNEVQTKVAEFTTKYDFLVMMSDQMTNIQLIHENVSLTTLGKGISAKDYIEVVKTQLSALPDFGYEFEETETVTLGGQEFTKMSSTSSGGALIQDYYVVLKGDYISGLTVSYTPDSAESATSIISGIVAAD